MSLSNAHTIKKTFSLSPKLSGPPASNHTFEVCKEDSNLIPVGSSWVGGGDSAALNGPFDGVKHPPSLRVSFSLALAPGGSPPPKGKRRGGSLNWASPCHAEGFPVWLCCWQARSVACSPLSHWGHRLPRDGFFPSSLLTWNHPCEWLLWDCCGSGAQGAQQLAILWIGKCSKLLLHSQGTPH